MKTKIELLDQVIDIEIEYYVDNSGMDYEWWGHKESIKSEDYPVIEIIRWDESKFTQDENNEIYQYVWDDKQIERFEKLLMKQNDI